ncbi:ABC transporter ATP-binding protein [Salipaludibacillus sp. HK11]|uniref:ABC transporter ATP-binding protein n=1 Tax=Salipaludibacillus sp. HK11 TaxID=3394320 RepID=UPI0039FDE030
MTKEQEREKEQNIDYESHFDNKNLSKGHPLRILGLLYRDHKKKLFLSFVFFMFKHSPVWVMPIVIANMINIAMEPETHTINDMWLNIIILLAVIIQNLPTQVLHVSYMSQAIRHVEAGLRSALIRKLQHLSISYHGELQSGKLQAKVLRDVEMIETLSKQMIIAILPALMNVIVALAVTTSRSLLVSSFFLLTIPIATALVIFFRGKIKYRNRVFRQQVETMSGKVAETVEMIPVTRAHGLENVEITKIDSELHNLRGKGYKLDMVEAFFGASNWVVFQIFAAFCLMFTAYLAFNGQIPVGDIALYQTYFMTILMSITHIITVYPQIAKGLESIYSVSEVLLSRELEEYQGKKKIDHVDGDFQFENVDFGYRNSEKHVLQNLNLTIKAGESIAFVGESGAGKSTVLNLVTGFYRPSNGGLIVDGNPMDGMDIQSYRQHIAVVPQNTILFSGSIRENITYGLVAVSEEKIQQVVDMANLNDVINDLPEGLDTKIGEHGGKLSGGQRQRISIARAIIRDPKVIILDEATSALDNVSEHNIQEAMLKLIEGRTTFMVAHRLSTIRNADRIVVMKQGACVEIGTYEELMAKQGEFYLMKKMQDF